MKDWKLKLPALMLCVALLTSFNTVWPGGRDVPEQRSNGSNSSAEYELPGDGEAWCRDGAVATTLSFGPISVDIVTMPAGTLRLQPTLLTDMSRAIRRTFGTGGDRGTCSAD